MTAEEKTVAANVLAVSKAKSDSLKPTVLPILTIAAAVLAILSIAVFTLENRKTFHGTTENICFLSAPGARNADTSSYSIVWLCCLKSYTKKGRCCQSKFRTRGQLQRRHIPHQDNRRGLNTRRPGFCRDVLQSSSDSCGVWSVSAGHHGGGRA